ncbi:MULTISPECIES: ABC transporter substrate-binding protein [unclassified Paenibacillus]|uniref:ABC transporter substrate-binding protein n=1 Tax=unclassified Paenibacillus TaxID=185978 RepID=UPI001AE7878A|nr:MULTISPECIES: ABC transporter substrate-binding protein [unclassified Paenibacillus]MBP1154149.1 ABC-type nitrate/sulfonate/bicarbonate transport system substrate-binding protein [Paenibacillus sp. PvP091]MBP1170466.1 ABC-type nitrate/sulfonate/bicarbonate transport system substrate-binding protein [Paenibacillus sp. PvR098]MBP2441494.1 ABC-type nitrate/sulfonate/bicarbonate transport system substrate-binding protein [Paenibacillus sp. PvP052]
MEKKGYNVGMVCLVFFWILLTGCGSAATITTGASTAPSSPSSTASTPPAGHQNSSSAAVQPIDLSIFSVSVSGLEIPTWVALDNNLFQKHGINPKWTTLPPPTGVQALLSKDAHIGATPGNAISAYASGAKDLIFVAGNNDKAIYKIMTNTLAKAEDLKGKKIGVSGRYAPPSVAFMNYMEREFKLKPDEDYKLVTFQTISDILPALDKGLIDAGVLSSPLDIKAQKQGAKILVDLAKTYDEAQAYVTTTKAFAKENPDAVLRYLKAYIEGIEMAKKNPDLAVASIMKYQKGITAEEAQISYNDYIHTHDVNMNVEAFKPYQIYSDNPKVAGINVADMLDYSFLQQLDKSGFLKQHGFTLKNANPK